MSPLKFYEEILAVILQAAYIHSSYELMVQRTRSCIFIKHLEFLYAKTCVKILFLKRAFPRFLGDCISNIFSRQNNPIKQVNFDIQVIQVSRYTSWKSLSFEIFSYINFFFNQTKYKILLLEKLVQPPKIKLKVFWKVLYVCISLKTELRRKICWNSS